MEKFFLNNHSVLEVFSTGGFPLEEASELGYRYDKGIIYRINCVNVFYIFLFLLIIVITILFLLCIIPSSTLH
jgi:hypothetical protein